jgi:hypothetical protein
MEATFSYEASVDFQHTIQRYIPGDRPAEMERGWNKRRQGKKECEDRYEEREGVEIG